MTPTLRLYTQFLTFCIVLHLGFSGVHPALAAKRWVDSLRKSTRGVLILEGVFCEKQNLHMVALALLHWKRTELSSIFFFFFEFCIPAFALRAKKKKRLPLMTLEGRRNEESILSICLLLEE